MKLSYIGQVQSDVLKKAQVKIADAGDEIKKLVGTRTRQIQKTLKSFEILPNKEVNLLLGESNDTDDTDDIDKTDEET